MTTYRVFLGAPSIKELDNDPASYHWQSFSSRIEKTQELLPTPSDFPALQTLDDASRRISLIYQNVIFNEDADLEESFEHEPESILQDQTTAITWPPTPIEGESTGQHKTTELSFLNATTRSSFDSLLETQPTQETQSFNYSDASSIARFPTFHFNLHSITSLTHLSKQKVPGPIKMSTVAAVLEVEGPDTITIKNGRDAGKEVAILKMIIGDEGGTICKLTAWRQVAEQWGGLVGSVAVKRGDIVLVENATIVFNSKTSPTITASPFLKSSMTICYRTMPNTREDNRLRPDLRLGQSDASVRKVAAVVTWFQELAGLTANNSS